MTMKKLHGLVSGTETSQYGYVDCSALSMTSVTALATLKDRQTQKPAAHMCMGQ